MKSLAFVLIFLLASAASAQQVTISGTVTEQKSGEAVGGASIAILGTSKGTKANSAGVFRISVQPHVVVQLRVTAIGYRPDTIRITATRDTIRNVALRLVPLKTEPIVVTADHSRVEARRIIRTVIDKKKIWQEAIQDYSFDVYGKLNAKTVSGKDTTVFSILESAAKGYWKRDMGYAERMIARKQTSNLPSSINRFTLLGILNFYNDRLELPEYSIPTPVATDAFDHYDYDLVGTTEVNGVQAYHILVEPRGMISPAFEGDLYIDKELFAITYLSLKPNKAVKIGPLRDGWIEQIFQLVDNTYWLPKENRFHVAATFTLPLIPTFTAEHVGVLQNYRINQGVPDSLFVGSRREIDTSVDAVDSVTWAQLRAVPLETEEEMAYHRIDSIAQLPREESGFSPIGFLTGLILNPSFYSFNRVEGSRFQIGYNLDDIGDWPLSVGAYGAYGYSDKQFKYYLGLRQSLLWTEERVVTGSIGSSGFSGGGAVQMRPILSLGFRLYDDLETRGSEYPRVINTLTSLLFRSDYPDYFRTKGGAVDLTYTPHVRDLNLTLSLINERQLNAPATTDFTFFNRDRGYRVNPSITEGLLRGARLGLEGSTRLLGMDYSVFANLFVTHGDVGSDFTFATWEAGIEWEFRLGGWGKSYLALSHSELHPGSKGLGSQHLLFVETHNAYLSSRDAFRTMGPRQFEGDNLSSLTLEHNFNDLPVRLLGVSFLEPLQLHWIAFGKAASVRVSDKTIAAIGRTPNITGDTPFVEAGFGVSNIFNIARVDVAWRLTHRRASNGFVNLLFNTSF